MTDVQVHHDFMDAVEAAAYQNYVVDHMHHLMTDSYDDVKSVYVMEATHQLHNTGKNLDWSEYGFPVIEWKPND